MKRRDFLTNSTLTAAGLAASTTLFGSELLIPRAKLDKIGFQVYTVRNQVKDSLESTLEQLAKYGYDYAEVYGLNGNSVMGHPIKKVKKAFNDVGIEIRSAHCGTGFGGQTSGTMAHEWQKGVDAAAELGVQHVVLAYLVANERKSLDDYKKVTDLLNTCGEATQKSGIQMGYHNHAFEFETLEGKEPMQVIMEDTDPDLVKFELDIYWSTVAQRNALDLFEKYAGRINLWHVKDMMKSETKMTEVGNGRIDWKSIFAKADVAGMTGFFVEQDGNWSDSDIESLGASHKYLKKLRY